jgi:hypothetical protein
MISKPQIRTTIYTAFYRVVRVGTQPTLGTFYQKTLKQTLPSNQPDPPSDFDDFWWEAIALEMQNGFMAYKAYLPNLDGPWLRQHVDEKWQEVFDFTCDNIESLIPI